MPDLIDNPTLVPVPGGKRLEEYVGAVNSGTDTVSVAVMHSPAGWTEPGQCPDFDEFTLVLKGTLQVESKGETLQVRAGQAVVARKGEWIRYSSPHGAHYVAVCVPAFTTDRVHRDSEKSEAGS